MCALPGQGGKEKSLERGAVTSPTTHTTIQTRIIKKLKKTRVGGIVADNRIWSLQGMRRERDQDAVHRKSSKNYGQETITRRREGWDVQEFLKIFEFVIRFTTSAIQHV